MLLERAHEMKLVNKKRTPSISLSATPVFPIKRQSQQFKATQRSNSNFQTRNDELVVKGDGKTTT